MEGQSLIVEGIHLNAELCRGMMWKYKERCICINVGVVENTSELLRRCRLRTPNFSINPENNEYVKYFDNILWIQDYILRKAQKYNS